MIIKGKKLKEMNPIYLSYNRMGKKMIILELHVWEQATTGRFS